jgi:hypothetical protein
MESTVVPTGQEAHDEPQALSKVLCVAGLTGSETVTMHQSRSPESSR